MSTLFGFAYPPPINSNYCLLYSDGVKSSTTGIAGALRHKPIKCNSNEALVTQIYHYLRGFFDKTK